MIVDMIGSKKYEDKDITKRSSSLPQHTLREVSCRHTSY